MPDHPVGLRFLAETYAELNQPDEARAALGQYLRLAPRHTIAIIRDNVGTPTPTLLECLIEHSREASQPRLQ